MPTIAIINYGVGNLRSVKRGLEQSDATVTITDKVSDIIRSDAMVLPGVGAFKGALRTLTKLSKPILKQADAGKPILGICLGYQILFTRSHEGGIRRGLDLLQGEVVKLSGNVKLPHIGWNTVSIARADELVDGVKDGSYMYFVHSYSPKPSEKKIIVAYTNYGETFPSIVSQGNVFATQFHPEKSGTSGLRILENFVGITKR
jgi:glutamine amidotransferase